MSLVPRDVRDLVLRPVLAHLQLPSGEEGGVAEMLLLGIAAHESAGFTRLRQNVGPARGLWEVEPPTAEWLMDGFLARAKHADLRLRVRDFLAPWPRLAEQLAGNLFLCCALARVKLYSDREPLPAEPDPMLLAQVWKRVFNSVKGAGRPEQFVEAYRRWVEPLY